MVGGWFRRRHQPPRGGNLRLSRTSWSWLPYGVAFAAIGPYATFGAPQPAPPAAWFVIALALLGVGAHAANALPDVVRDLAAGASGLAPGRDRTRLFALASVAGATATIVLVLAWSAPGAAIAAGTALAVAIGATILRAQDDRTEFVAIMGLALVDVVLIVVAGVPLNA